MMRPGDKLASYRLLSASLTRLRHVAWQLLIVGDGPARADVEAAVAPLGANRVHFLGQWEEHELPALYAAADLMVWPAINEAYGMALLEAQASGLPVVAGHSGGIPEIVRDGKTGLLTDPDNADSFAQAIISLLAAPRRRGRMGAAARSTVAREHSLTQASRRLDRIIQNIALPVPPQRHGP
jgi:glycosyltransferase involved in cell wall biosynthesis